LPEWMDDHDRIVPLDPPLFLIVGLLCLA